MKKELMICKKVRCFMLLLISSFVFITASSSIAQITRSVLFLGNSYTYVNNLPQMIHDVALSAGDTLVFDSYAPGGYRLSDHYNDSISQNKIIAGGWNYVVLQGQSQEPITNTSNFRNGGFALNHLAVQYDPCSVTMLYMTWGRKNGDTLNCATFPEMCTYQGMDTTLRNEYLKLASDIKGEIAPVSVAWNYLRQNYPGIELYQPDESHPSLAGSYAAACCFYAALFKKDPTLITFNPGLSAADASIIKAVVKTEVFDNLNLWDYKQPPVSEFIYNIGAGVNEVNFIPVNNYGTAETYLWNFGDGDTSAASNPTHSYLSDGTYPVSLTTTNCDLQGLHISITDTVIQFCSHTPGIYITNPWLCNHDTLWTQPADSYQWFVNGISVPETNQYLPDYYQYNFGNVSVLATVNGCSEMSQGYSNLPVWSGYYFDIWPVGNPCTGDTVPFAVLHTSGSLSGFEIIEWYKNDTLLASMANEDTLYITEGGTYECKVVNPLSSCPTDTTSYRIEFNCGITDIKNNDQDLSWSIFPNPASETITVKFTNDVIKQRLQIYSATGSLVKVMETSATTEINIADLPTGLYLIRLMNNEQPPLKFIKQ
jgi:PKD repeat protein